jgi:hypothetical protein
VIAIQSDPIPIPLDGSAPDVAAYRVVAAYEILFILDDLLFGLQIVARSPETTRRILTLTSGKHLKPHRIFHFTFYAM